MSAIIFEYQMTIKKGQEALTRSMLSRYLKWELNDKGLTYKQFARKLRSHGYRTDIRSVTNKLARGSFSAAFFYMALKALGKKDFSLGDMRKKGAAKEKIRKHQTKSKRNKLDPALVAHYEREANSRPKDLGSALQERSMPFLRSHN